MNSVPSIPKKVATTLTNKQILERHKKTKADEVKTIQIRQVDVEKVVDKLPPPQPDDDNDEEENTSNEMAAPVPIPLPDNISAPKIKKIKKIKPPAVIDVVEVVAEETEKKGLVEEIEKKGLLEQNGEGYYINDEEELEKIEGLKNIDLYTLLFELSNRIYHEMGAGHTESVYQKALTIELINHEIYHEKEKRVLITYQDKKHGRVYSLGEERVDVFLLDYNLIIELKAVNNIPREQELAQIRKYYRELLKAGTILDKWGLIINFPQPGPTKKAKPTIDFVLVSL